MKYHVSATFVNYFVDAFLGETMKTLESKLQKEELTLVERDGSKLSNNYFLKLLQFITNMTTIAFYELNEDLIVNRYKAFNTGNIEQYMNLVT